MWTVQCVPHHPGSSDGFSWARPFLTCAHLLSRCLDLISKTYTAILSGHKYSTLHLMHSLKTNKMESLSSPSSSSAAGNSILAQSGITQKAQWPLGWTFLNTLLVYGQHKMELHIQAGGLKWLKWDFLRRRWDSQRFWQYKISHPSSDDPIILIQL